MYGSAYKIEKYQVMKHQAISYLKYLHELEEKYRSNLITLEIASLVEQVRLEFVAVYRER